MRKEESQSTLERQLRKFLIAVEILECRSDHDRFQEVLRELLKANALNDYEHELR
jgi:hypothetical protein